MCPTTLIIKEVADDSSVDKDLVDINLNDHDDEISTVTYRSENHNRNRNFWDDFVNCFAKILLLSSVYLCLWTVNIANTDIDTLFVVLGSSVIIGFLAGSIMLPPLLGMILAGVMLRNIPAHSFSDELPRSYYIFVRSIGLMVILLRSGLELDFLSLTKNGWKAVLSLTCFPAITEALVCGFCAFFLLKMPIMFAMTLGFILSAVSPAVVVTGMLSLQDNGYGITKGIPTLVIASASFDDIIAISGFSMFVDFAFQDNNSNFVEHVMHGPSTIIFGLLLGCFGGVVLSLNQIWNQSWKVTAALMICGFIFTFGMSKLHFAGSGMLACLVMGIVFRSPFVNQYVSNNSSRSYLKKKDQSAKNIAMKLTLLWENFCEPLLFGVIGHALYFGNKFKTMHDIMPSLLIILSGLVFRIMMAYIATFSKVGLITNERVFIALSWIPKATVQAALCSLPLDLAKETDPIDNDAIEWSQIIMNTSILSILVTAPIGSMILQYCGPRLLTKG